MKKPKPKTAPDPAAAVQNIIAAAVGSSASGEKDLGAARIQQAMADAAAQAHRDNIVDPEEVKALKQAARQKVKAELKAGEEKYRRDSEILDRSGSSNR